jgi:hypothetical protein
MQFRDEFRFLSNFWPCRIRIRIGNDFAIAKSVEHAYQALKTTDDELRRQVINCATPGQAKRLGQKLELRSGWNENKVKLMEMLVRQKFHDRILAHQLLSTGDMHLEEENNWGDTFWGTVNGEGQNHLGKILMMIREELKNDPKIHYVP